MGKIILWKKCLVTVIVVLFIGVCIYPTVAEEPIISNNNITDVSIIPKNFLFQTIIDIANNPDVKNLLQRYSGKIHSVNHDSSMVREILIKKPLLLIPTLFTKSSMTTDYLNHIYDKGVEITSILGEERTFKILDSTKNTNPKFYEELDKIIKNDEELSYRLNILKDMNYELKFDTPNPEYPIICAIVVPLYYLIVSILDFIDYIPTIFGEDTIIGIFLYALLSFPYLFFWGIGVIVYYIADGHWCWD